MLWLTAWLHLREGEWRVQSLFPPSAYPVLLWHDSLPRYCEASKCGSGPNPQFQILPLGQIETSSSKLRNHFTAEDAALLLGAACPLQVGRGRCREEVGHTAVPSLLSSLSLLL